MTITGHVKLGFAGDLRDYMLVQPDGLSEALVNPMGVKTSQGAGSYDAYDGFAYWVQETWSLGNGVNPKETGGYAFGEIDSRYDERLFILPRHWPTNLKARGDAASTWNHPGSYNYQFVAGPDNTYTKVAVPLGSFSTDLEDVWVYQTFDDVAPDTTVELWHGASWPSTYVATTTVTADITTRRSGYRHGSFSPAITGNGVSNYWLVLSPSDESEFPSTSGSFPTSTSPKLYENSAWRAVDGSLDTVYRPFFLTDIDRLPDEVTAASTFNGEFYVGCADGGIYKRIGSGDNDEYYELVDTAAAGILQMIEWWDKLVLIEDGSAVEFMSTGEVLTTGSFTAQLALIHRGFFWYATDNEVFYDSTETLATPSSALTFNPGSESVRGMSPAGDYILVATDSSLWRITPGDFIEGILRWDYPDETHGVGMLQREGAAYIPYGNAVLRYAENVPLSNIWIRDAPLPDTRAGSFAGMLSTNKELILLVNSDQASAWSWNYQGWHCIAVFPPGYTLNGAVYDYSTSRIYYLMKEGVTFWSLAARTDQIATFQTGTQFMPDSWIDTGEYYANLYTVEKDVESVEIIGDDITPESPVTIFWQDEESTDWERLGTISESGQLIRWDDPDERPATKFIRLGLLIQTRDESVSPMISAIVLRHYPTIIDRWQYRLPLILAPLGSGLGGMVEDRDVDDLVEHLNSLVGATPPVRFVDMKGVEREVKISHATKRPSRYETAHDGRSTQYGILYDVTAEAILGQDYVAPVEPEITDPTQPSLSFIETFEFDTASESGYLPALIPFM